MTKEEVEKLKLKIVKDIANGEKRESYNYVNFMCEDLPGYASYLLDIKEKVETYLLWDSVKHVEKRVGELKEKSDKIVSLIKKFSPEYMAKLSAVAQDKKLMQSLTDEDKKTLIDEITVIIEMTKDKNFLLKESNSLTAYAALFDLGMTAGFGPALEFEKKPKSHGLMLDHDKVTGVDKKHHFMYIVDDLIRVGKDEKPSSRASRAAIILHEFRHAWQHETGEHTQRYDYNKAKDSKDKMLLHYASDCEFDADKFAFETMLELKHFAKENLSNEEYARFIEEYKVFEKQFKKRLLLHKVTKLRRIKIAKTQAEVTAKVSKSDVASVGA